MVELTKAQTSASAGGDTDTNALKEKSELELKIKQLTDEKEILKSDLGEIVNITYGGMIDLSLSDWIITVSHIQRIILEILLVTVVICRLLLTCIIWL